MPLLHWTFDQGTVGQLSAEWSLDSQSVYGDVAQNNGTNTNRHRITGETNGFGVFGGIIELQADYGVTLSQGDEVWYRYQIFFDDGLQGVGPVFNFDAGGSLKVSRFRIATAAGVGIAFNDLYSNSGVNPAGKSTNTFPGESARVNFDN